MFLKKREGRISVDPRARKQANRAGWSESVLRAFLKLKSACATASFSQADLKAIFNQIKVALKLYMPEPAKREAALKALA